MKKVPLTVPAVCQTCRAQRLSHAFMSFLAEPPQHKQRYFSSYFPSTLPSHMHFIGKSTKTWERLIPASGRHIYRPRRRHSTQVHRIAPTLLPRLLYTPLHLPVAGKNTFIFKSLICPLRDMAMNIKAPRILKCLVFSF